MRHKVYGKKLNRSFHHRQALFKNLINALIIHGKIKTTQAKAKAVKGLIDKLVVKAKIGTLHARRQLLSFLNNKTAVKKLIEEIAPKAITRTSGFTRMIKIGRRKGDQAPVVNLELIADEQKNKNENKTDKSKRHQA